MTILPFIDMAHPVCACVIPSPVVGTLLMEVPGTPIVFFSEFELKPSGKDSADPTWISAPHTIGKEESISKHRSRVERWPLRHQPKEHVCKSRKESFGEILFWSLVYFRNILSRSLFSGWDSKQSFVNTLCNQGWGVRVCKNMIYDIYMVHITMRLHLRGESGAKWNFWKAHNF